MLSYGLAGEGIVRTLLIRPFLIMPLDASLMWEHLI
jgi:hypothetical protein